MRTIQDRTEALIREGGFERVWVADLIYDGDRRLSNVPISDPSLSWDGTAQIVGSGSCRVVWNDDFAQSYIPREIGDWFSPFGAELQIDLLIGSGADAERLQMGRFVIDSVPEAEESAFRWHGRTLHVGESFGLALKDRMLRIVRDPFPFPTAPRQTSAWAEIQNITGFPVIQNVSDATIPTTITHDENRAAALSEMFDLLNAWPALTPAGVLTARTKAWPAAVDTLDGAVVSAPRTLESDKTYNRVVVEGKSPSGDPVYGVAEVTEGFLRVRNADGSRSPFGVATYRYQSDYLTTSSQCDAYARQLLPRVSRIRSVLRDVTERFNPLREVGDVLTFEGGLVRVQKISHSGALTQMVVEVSDD